jgi:hypothetical protein
MVDQAAISADGMKYTFLAQGRRQPVLPEDYFESLKRWGKKDRFGQLLMADTGRITPVEEDLHDRAR